MVTITEDYVSFEVAKLLKEKGFNEICRAAYTNDGKFITHHNYYSQGGGDECVAPTHQMAMKWLLKKHNIFICILFLEDSDEYGYTIENIITKKYMATSKNSSYKKPENACESALKYCLENLI